MEQLARGRKVYEEPRYMTVNTCIEQMLQVEEEKRAAGGGGAYSEDTLCIGLAKIGCSGQTIVSGTMKQVRPIPIRGRPGIGVAVNVDRPAFVSLLVVWTFPS